MKKIVLILLTLSLLLSLLVSCTFNGKEEETTKTGGNEDAYAIAQYNLAEPLSYAYRFNGHWLTEKSDFSPLKEYWTTTSALGQSVTINGMEGYGVCYQENFEENFAFTFSVKLPCAGVFGVALDGSYGAIYLAVNTLGDSTSINLYSNNTILYKEFPSAKSVEYRVILDLNSSEVIRVFLYSGDKYLCGMQSKRLSDENKQIVKSIDCISFYTSCPASSDQRGTTFYDIGLNQLGENYYLDKSALLAKFEAWAEREINGSKKTSDNQVVMFTPDGLGSYNALWTRDFYYMLAYGDTITVEEAIACIEYLLEHAHPTSKWIPDRVYADGTTNYAAGAWQYDQANLDNNSFIVMAIDYVLDRMEASEAQAFFLEWHDTLKTSLSSLEKDAKGLLYNNPTVPHSVYGFTDCICKTGSLMYESLLFWQASTAMVKWEKKYGLDSTDCEKWVKDIEKNLLSTFTAENGMLYAATQDCHQLDIWGSCYIVSIGFPMEESQKKNIADYLAKNYDGIVQFGQLRHTEKGTYWQRLLSQVNLGEYQNGAYWATPTGWLVDALEPYYPDLAMITLQDLAFYFENFGIFECINGDYTKLDHYGASASNILQSARRLLGENK